MGKADSGCVYGMGWIDKKDIDIITNARLSLWDDEGQLIRGSHIWMGATECMLCIAENFIM